MKKIKIIIFIYSLGGGGIQKFATNLMNNIDKDKFEINLVLVKEKGTYLETLPAEINVIGLNAKKVHFSLLPLIKILNREKPDVLFCVGTNINIIGILAKKLSKNNPKLIIRQAVEINKTSTSKLRTLLIKVLYRSVDECVVLTNSMKNNLINSLKLSGNKLKVIYNAIDIKDITIKREEVLDDSFQRIGSPRIIAVGRLTHQKNQIMLIEAFQLVLLKHDAHLVVIGEGEDYNKLKQKIIDENLESKITLLGFKTNPYKYVFNSDIFVLASLYEGLSNALLEALACDIPIVTTDNPDQIIQNRVNGLQANINKVDIASKLEELIEDKELYNNIIHNNESYKKDFDITIMTKRYEKIFEEI